MIIQGDCLEKLLSLKDNSIDSLITDPPAGISFMGKDWDNDKGGRIEWIAWFSAIMRECLRVLKPGAHGLVWAIPRTSHWTATALEDAGFEIRDVVTHIFGSGFPKSLDISKAIDKAAGAEREVIGKMKAKLPTSNGKFATDNWSIDAGKMRDIPLTAPSTHEAKKWQGFGTALKPASEHWILVRKPLSEKTVAANVLKHGVGGLNIDGSRIGIDPNDINHRKPSVDWQNANNPTVTNFGSGGRPIPNLNNLGRFPANLVLSHNEDCETDCTDFCAVAMLDKQSLAGGMHSAGKANTLKGNKIQGNIFRNSNDVTRIGDSGGASRFFYCAKASKKDKNAGLEGMPEIECGIGDDRPSGQSMSRLDGRPPRKSQNTHPTVKSTQLMSYLIKLITPPNGIVLDPFMGSGSTGVAALREGFRFIGIEMEKEYIEIAEKRIAAVGMQAT